MVVVNSSTWCISGSCCSGTAKRRRSGSLQRLSDRWTCATAQHGCCRFCNRCQNGTPCAVIFGNHSTCRHLADPSSLFDLPKSRYVVPLTVCKHKMERFKIHMHAIKLIRKISWPDPKALSTSVLVTLPSMGTTFRCKLETKHMQEVSPVCNTHRSIPVTRQRGKKLVRHQQD